MQKLWKHQRICITLCMLLLLTICLGGTSAYLSHIKSRSAPLSVGDNTIQIMETFEKPDQYQPNTTYQKEVQVKNTGNVPCYVRMLVKQSDSDIPVTIDIDTSSWIKKEDYYYYHKILEVGQQTTPMFTQVRIGNVEEHHLKTFEVIVYAESVQSYGYENIDAAFADMH